MANWCSNTVVFEGEPEAIKQIQQLFQTMKKRKKKTSRDNYPTLFPKPMEGISLTSIGMTVTRVYTNTKQGGRPMRKS